MTCDFDPSAFRGRVVGKPYLKGLRKSFPSSGRSEPLSSAATLSDLGGIDLLAEELFGAILKALGSDVGHETPLRSSYALISCESWKHPQILTLLLPTP
jgi:hypothetical protein